MGAKKFMQRQKFIIAWEAKKNSRLQENENFSFYPPPQRKNTTLLTWVGVKWNQVVAQTHVPLELQRFEEFIAHGSEAPWWKMWNLLFSQNN